MDLMKRLLIGCGMLTFCGTIANADLYEVIPFHATSIPAVNAASYQALVLDNKTGSIYLCAILLQSHIDLGKTSDALTSTCNNYSKKITSTLSPSQNLVSKVQIQENPTLAQNVLRVPGLWQINSKTGDVQFCLTSESSAPASCVKLVWRGRPHAP
jgi:hypothetical protein